MLLSYLACEVGRPLGFSNPEVCFEFGEGITGVQTAPIG
jgi:hypothetical protein